MISIGKRCVQYLPLATTSFTWLHTVRGCTRIRELVQKGGGRPCPISHPNSVYREPYINNCYASHIGFQSPHRISGLGIDHYWSRGHSIRCICTTRSIFQDNATSDDDFEGKHQSKEPGTVEDVQIAIEEAMIEALHLMEKDKIEHAEMLITEGLERRQEGANLIEKAHMALKVSFGEDFEPLYEAAFYSAIANLSADPQQGFSSTTMHSLEASLLKALKGMQEIPTVGRHLLRAAFREHRSLMDAAVTRSDWNLAEEILLQAIRLQEEVSPGSDESALTTYQYGTLQYVRGNHKNAMEICQQSLDLARKLYKKESHSQVALRVHRLGTIQLASANYGEALKSLEPSLPRLVMKAGESNPLTGESKCALSLAKLALLRGSENSADPCIRILLPNQRHVLKTEAEQGLSDMKRGFGKHHMLVKKLQAIYDEILAFS